MKFSRWVLHGHAEDNLIFHPPTMDFQWSEDPDEYTDFINAIKKREALGAGADETQGARLEEGWCKYCASEKHAQCEWLINTGDPFRSPVCTCPNASCGSRSQAAIRGTTFFKRPDPAGRHSLIPKF